MLFSILYIPYKIRNHFFWKLIFFLILSQCIQGQEEIKIQQPSKRFIKQSAVIDNLNKTNGPTEKKIRAYLNICWTILNVSGEFNKAEGYIETIDSLMTIEPNDRFYAELYTIKGRLWSKQGLFRSAIKSYQQAYSIRETEKDTAKMGYILQVMAKTYRHQKRYKESIIFLNQSLEYKKIVGKLDPHITLGMLADSYFRIDSIGKAKIIIQRAIDISKKQSKKRAYYQYKILKASIACKEGRRNDCLELSKKAYQGFLKNKGSKGEIIEAEIGLARAYLYAGNNDKALNFATSGLEKARANKDGSFEVDALQLLAEIYEDTNDFKSAFLFTQQYSKYKKHFFDEEEIRRNLDFQREWSLNEKENQLVFLKQINFAQTKLIQQSKKTNVLLYMALVFMLIIMLSTYFIFRYRSKIKHEEIEIEKLTEKNKLDKQKLESLILGQEMERNRVAKELHDGLGGMLSIGSLKIEQQKVTLKEIQKIIDDSCEELRRVSLDMMPVSLEVLGLKPALEDLIAREIYSGLNITFEMNKKLQKHKDQDIHIYRIIQELLNNCLKHAKANQVLIQIIKNENISLIYEDNGIGFNVNQEFTGRGMNNIKARVRYLNGMIEIESNNGNGTFINIDVPKYKGIND